MSDQAWIEWILGDSERKKLGSLENEWKQNAICSIENIPTKVFYPERKRGDVAAAFARKICFRCPVRIDCAQWAIKANEDYGVFGGASPRQRQKMKSLGTADVLDIMPKEKKNQSNLT